MACDAVLKRSPAHVRSLCFCNMTCRKAFHRAPITCLGCGAQFDRQPSFPTRKYCTWDCFKASRWREMKCAECGVIFKKRISEIKKVELTDGQHMCSRACRNAATSKLLGGDGTWQVGGKYGPARKRGKDWRHARAFVLERDHYTCQQCSSTEHLEVHHWEPYFVSFDNSPDNLVTLCRTCHQDKHEEYRREGFYADLHR